MSSHRPLPTVLALACIVLALCPGAITPRRASAASRTFEVNSTQDTPDASPGDGACATSTGACTLRAAVQEANAQPAGSTITINLPAGTYGLTLGVLTLAANTISGADRTTTTIDGGELSRVLSISSTVHATLTGVTISGAWRQAAVASTMAAAT